MHLAVLSLAAGIALGLVIAFLWHRLVITAKSSMAERDIEAHNKVQAAMRHLAQQAEEQPVVERVLAVMAAKAADSEEPKSSNASTPS
jgi:hypothetical protein